MCLVNFPEYLARERSGGADMVNGGDASTLDGKKHCVMCGKLRTCSSNNSKTNCKKGSMKDNASKSDETEATYIIPRQNKGVCTACDVAVWVVTDAKDRLEIKWCKGCKNFRPWMAFGEKRMATKCVRCRTRQKETYASQKQEYLNKQKRPWATVRTLIS
jgi:hypothetical protein